jgi:hypothetical protein
MPRTRSCSDHCFPLSPGAHGRARHAGRQWRSLHRLRLVACAAVLALAMGCGSDGGPDRGEAVAVVEVASLPKAAIDQSTAASGLQALSGPARCDVSVRQLDYRTLDPRGADLILVSAALLVPSGPDCSGPFPLVAYSKGTDIIRARTLANAADPETALLVGMFAARG